MAKPHNFNPFITVWEDGGTGYFKIAQIFIPETGTAEKLEAAAKQIARDIQAEVMYAWDLGDKRSDAWWLGWGGYDLEEEVPFHAAMSLPVVAKKIAEFDSKDNEFECANIEEYRELLFNAYDEELSAEDLKQGFLAWTKELTEEASATLYQDLQSWIENARKAT
ncbi:MAG: hypothetical protein NXI13_11680 [Proteobacteria bacterium]|nr:hypothetical protein [Pseudomonadota bacterium]